MFENQTGGLTIILMKHGDGASTPGVREFLRREGHDVVEALTVEDLIDQAMDFTSAVRPDLILMDADSLSGDEFSHLASFCRETGLREIPLMALSEDEGSASAAQMNGAKERPQTRTVTPAHLGDVLGTLAERRTVAAA